MRQIGTRCGAQRCFARRSSPGSGRLHRRPPHRRARRRCGSTYDTDIDYVDPALAYYMPTWQLEHATCAKLLRYPDPPPPQGHCWSRRSPPACRPSPGRPYLHLPDPQRLRVLAARNGPRHRSEHEVHVRAHAPPVGGLAGAVLLPGHRRRAEYINGQDDESRHRRPGEHAAVSQLVQPAGDFLARLRCRSCARFRPRCRQTRTACRRRFLRPARTTSRPGRGSPAESGTVLQNPNYTGPRPRRGARSSTGSGSRSRRSANVSRRAPPITGPLPERTPGARDAVWPGSDPPRNEASSSGSRTRTPRPLPDDEHGTGAFPAPRPGEPTEGGQLRDRPSGHDCPARVRRRGSDRPDDPDRRSRASSTPTCTRSTAPTCLRGCPRAGIGATRIAAAPSSTRATPVSASDCRDHSREPAPDRDQRDDPRLPGGRLLHEGPDARRAVRPRQLHRVAWPTTRRVRLRPVCWMETRIKPANNINFAYFDDPIFNHADPRSAADAIRGRPATARSR